MGTITVVVVIVVIFLLLLFLLFELNRNFILYFELIMVCWHVSDNLDSSSILENSLSAKEKIISELNIELHNLETTLSNERELHMNEIKKLNMLLIEKVIILFASLRV